MGSLMPLLEKTTLTLSADESAICTEGDDIVIQLAQHEDVPDNHCFIIACAMRYYDEPEFRQEMIDWLREQTLRAS
jgi:kynurenine formamidase